MPEDPSPQQLGDATHAIGAHAALRVFNAARWLFGRGRRAADRPAVSRALTAIMAALDRNTPHFVWAALRWFIGFVRDLKNPNSGNATRFITLGVLTAIAAGTWFIASMIPRTAEGGVAGALELAGIIMLSVSVSMMVLIAIILGMIMFFVMKY